MSRLGFFWLACILAGAAHAQQPTVGFSLTSSAQNVVAGTPITFTATELNLFLYPGASMTFLDNGVQIPGSTALLDSHGVAVFTTTLPVGSHSISAVFSSCCNGAGPVTVNVYATAIPTVSLGGVALLAMLLAGMAGCMLSVRHRNAN